MFVGVRACVCGKYVFVSYCEQFYRVLYVILLDITPVFVVCVPALAVVLVDPDAMEITAPPNLSVRCMPCVFFFCDFFVLKIGN